MERLNERSVRIRFGDSDRPDVAEVITTLEGLQDSFIAIGRYLKGSAPAGHVPEEVSERTRLYIEKIGMKSPVEAMVSTPFFPTQVKFGLNGNLPEVGGLEEEVPERFLEIVRCLSDGEECNNITKLVTDAAHRIAILKNISSTVSDDKTVYFGPSTKPVMMSSLDRRSVERISLQIKEDELLIVKEKGVENFIGPVIAVQIAHGPYFKVGRQKCKFQDDDVPLIRPLLGYIVSVVARVEESKGRKEVEALLSVKKLEEWTLKSVMSGDIRLVFTEPVSAALSFEEGYVWITHKELGVYGVGEDWDKALEEYMDSFVDRFRAYAGCNDDELTPDALVLRDRFRQLVVDWKDMIQ